MAMKVMRTCTVLLVLSGCGGDDTTPSASPSEPSTSGSSSAPVMPLKAICPLVEQALPQAFLPSSEKLSAFADRLSELSRQGDPEAQNDVALLARPTADYVKVADKRGTPLLNGNQAWLAGITAFAKRCKAVGSSALQ